MYVCFMCRERILSDLFLERVFTLVKPFLLPYAYNVQSEVQNKNSRQGFQCMTQRKSLNSLTPVGFYKRVQSFVIFVFANDNLGLHCRANKSNAVISPAK